MNKRLLNSDQIREMLPYKFSIQLLDRVRMDSDNHYTGLKNLSFNEEFFQGHFPNHPIMPGVLQVEAMQQLAELALKDALDSEGGRDIYIKGLKKVKFRRPALPGDRLMVEIEIESLEKDTAVVKAVNRTSSGVTAQAGIVLGVRDRKVAKTLKSDFGEIDKHKDIAMDVTRIMEIIPHRYPFLLVDYIISFEGINVLAVKNVTANEPFYHKYSPECSVLPGAIQAEIIAQAGAVLMLSRPENKGKIAYFMSIESSECLEPVIPGDQLRIDVELPEGRSRFGRGQGSISVDGRLVSRTEITFAVVEA